MSDMKRIVCLANSRKLSGRCIAGREWSEELGVGDWFRPVSERKEQEVSEQERQYEDGSDPRVLDIIDIPVLEHQPKDHQVENWLLDPKSYWIKTGVFPKNRLLEIMNSVDSLWIDGHSTFHGSNDKIPLEQIKSVSDSLKLIHVETLTLSVFAPGEAFGNSKRRVQGQFQYAGAEYALWITDPKYERNYLAKQDGVYKLENCYLTISLGEPYRDDVYKLIAAVIEIE